MMQMGPGQIVMRALASTQMTLAKGTTAIRDCGGKDFLEFAVRDACNGGRQLGPTIMASGKVICMTGGHGNRNRVADGVDEVIKAVREQIHAGSDLIKIMATGGVMTPGVNLNAVLDEEMAPASTRGIASTACLRQSCAGAEGILNAVRGGVDSIEHGIFMDAECIDEMLAHGTYLVPTLAAVKNIVAFKDQGVPDYVVEKAMRVEERHQQSMIDFYRAGGRIAMGTDAGTPFNFHGANARELEYMVEIGISAADALTISTGNGADLMQNAAIGEIAAGKAADLLIVEGDPLADILMVADPVNHRQVVKNGVIVPPA